MQSSSARKVPGSSAGSTPPPAPVAPSAEDQPTVISGRGPMPVEPLDTGVPALPRLGPGSRLGSFELLECVGGGGMGRVYRARDLNLDRIVAVKVLSREQAADAETLLRFRNEALSAARLNHENIVQVYHVGEEEGLPYIVFEFIEGQNLRARVEQQGGLPLAEALSYTLQVTEALAHAAERNVVHRDIKPSNVLITGEGRVKLIDMGLARLQRPSAAGDLTASGVTLGTFDYISPEQARDPRTADVRSDIYSLGCTLFYMLAGQPPFPEGTVLQKLLQHQAENPPDIRRFRPDLPEEVSALLRRMMAKDPRRRFQSAAELTDALLRLAEQVGLHPLGLTPGMWARRPPPLSPLHRHLPWMVPVVLLLAVVVLLELLWSSPQGVLPAARPIVAHVEDGKLAPEGEEPLVPPEEWITEEEPAALPPGAGDTRPEGPSGAQPAGKGKAAASKSAEGTQTPGAALAAAAASDTPGGTSKGADGPSAPPGVPSVAGETPTVSAGKPASVQTAAEKSLAGQPTPADTGAAGSGASPARPGDMVPPSPGVLVVDGVGSAPNRFATLSAACAQATSGSVIELRYNGVREERPITLNNLKLTLRAGAEYRPVILFRPSDPDPALYPRAMITLAASQLTLVQVGVELEIPRELLADSWSLFELQQGESLRLEKSVLSIRNAADDRTAFHQEVAFFRLRSPAGMEAPMPPGSEPPVAWATLSLTDCIVRGEAALVRSHWLRPFQLTWNNGLLVTTERLLVADGGDRAPLAGDGMRVELQHLTAVVRGGLCQLRQSESAPYALPLAINCVSSILVGSARGPLIEQIGVAGKEPYERVLWNGERNFYEGFGTFWSVAPAQAEWRPAPQTFEAWVAYWGPQREILPMFNRVQWKKLPSADLPVHAHTVRDYLLSKPGEGGTANPAVKAAADGKDAGMTPEALPEIIAEPAGLHVQP